MRYGIILLALTVCVQEWHIGLIQRELADDVIKLSHASVQNSDSIGLNSEAIRRVSRICAGNADEMSKFAEVIAQAFKADRKILNDHQQILNDHQQMLLILAGVRP